MIVQPCGRARYPTGYGAYGVQVLKGFTEAVYVEISDEVMQQRAAGLAVAPFGEELLHVIGYVYRTKGGQYLGAMVSLFVCRWFYLPTNTMHSYN